jgi:diguanylate cyclase (GGDEF)-like protein
VPSALPLIVVAERDSTDVYEAWRRMLDLYVLSVVGLALLVGAAGYGLGRSIVTPLNQLSGAADRIASGDLDVALRVAKNDEIGHLTRVFNKMTDNLRRSRADTEAASRTLQQQNELLEKLSVRDGLTGLYNRKKLDEILLDQFARFRRLHRPFAVLMLDIDNFKAINDRHGHLAGDAVLERVASVLAQSIRNIDYAARFGGEEFVIVLVETEAEAACGIAERIRALVESTRYGVDADSISVTISVGVTDSRRDDDSPEAMLARADRALYRAKHAGRNKVQRADE